MACAWDGKLITICEVCLEREDGDEDRGCRQSFGADGIKLRGEGFNILEGEWYNEGNVKFWNQRPPFES